MEQKMGRASHYSENKNIILDAIERLTRQEGRPPSNRALAIEVGLGLATLHAYLRRLRDEGLIDWVERTHRSLRVRPQAHSNPSATSPPPAPLQTQVPVPVPVSAGSPVQIDTALDVGF